MYAIRSYYDSIKNKIRAVDNSQKLGVSHSVDELNFISNASNTLLDAPQKLNGPAADLQTKKPENAGKNPKKPEKIANGKKTGGAAAARPSENQKPAPEDDKLAGLKRSLALELYLRITSYNVCYTKLLRLKSERLMASFNLSANLPININLIFDCFCLLVINNCLLLHS